MTRVGLSWHGAAAEYDAYEQALLRRAQALGISLSTLWVAGENRPTRLQALAGLDAFCLTGGEDVEPYRYGRPEAVAVCHSNAARDFAELSMLEQIAPKPLPLLAICRGAQLLNVFHGGTLLPDLGERNDLHRAAPRRYHPVQIEPGSRLAGIAASTQMRANSSHHQAVDRVAERFTITARAPDGTIEALEPRDADIFTLAVQWHPELLEPGLPAGDGVLDAFLLAAC